MSLWAKRSVRPRDSHTLMAAVEIGKPALESGFWQHLLKLKMGIIMDHIDGHRPSDTASPILPC